MVFHSLLLNWFFFIRVWQVWITSLTRSKKRLPPTWIRSKKESSWPNLPYDPSPNDIISCYTCPAALSLLPHSSSAAFAYLHCWPLAVVSPDFSKPITQELPRRRGTSWAQVEVRSIKFEMLLGNFILIVRVSDGWMVCVWLFNPASEALFLCRFGAVCYS